MTDPRIIHIQNLERHIGTGDWDAAREFVTADLHYQVGARPAVVGVDGIREHMAWQVQRVDWNGHDLRHEVVDGDVVIIEVDSHFHRYADSSDIVLPCTDVYRFRGDAIYDWRVYADITAFFPPGPVEV